MTVRLAFGLNLQIILFRIIYAQNQITKLSITPLNACHYVELESLETQNAKSSTAFFKRGKYIQKGSFW